MSIYRVVKDNENPYVMINKFPLNDTKLSWKAKGLLCYMLSMPDDWKFYESELTKHAKDGRDSFRSAIKELILNGYINKGERIRDNKGLLKGYEYTVYECPIHSGESNVGLSNVGKPTTTNNNLTNNNYNNILHQTEFDDILNNYSLKRFNKPLRKSYNYIDTNVIEDMDEEMFIEFLDDNITCYDQCNYDYIEKIQDRAR